MTSQYNFCCLNSPNCDLSKKPVFTLECEEGEQESQFCPVCGEILKWVGRPSTIVPLKFNSLSVPEKREVLKKRSHEHFKKHIEEKKRDMDKNYW